MTDKKKQGWLSFLNQSHTKQAYPAFSARPKVEQLEGRLVPTGTPTLDLTASGDIGNINGAIFRAYEPQPTGTGVINSFVRIQANGKQVVGQGYNTDHRPVQFDENTSPQFTRLLNLSDVPVVDIGGVKYREFMLDINQKASSPLLSLDELRLYSSDVSLFGYDTTSHVLGGPNGVAPGYDLGAGNWIQLNARLSHGSGQGDMVADIPDSAFSGQYVYLYSKFGVNNSSNGGFEEWAAGTALTSASGSITGTITSSNTGQGVSDVLVFLDANQDGHLDSNEVYTYTNQYGNYQFQFLATGLGSYTTYQVTALAPTPTDGTTATIASTANTSVNWFDASLQTQNQVIQGVNFVVTYTANGGDAPPT